MSVRTLAVAVVALTCLAAPAPASALQDHGAHHGGELTLNQGVRWSTDAPLRQAMAALRADVARPDAADLPGRIDAQVQYMIDNCELPPEADAQLHLVIERLVDAADLMRAGHAAEGRARAVAALNAYGAHFDHPGWSPIDG